MQTNLYAAADAVNETFCNGKPKDILMSPIEIIVAGAAHTGKTVVAAIIEKALIDAGFTAVVAIDSESYPVQRRELAIYANTVGTGEDSFKNKPITIREPNMLFTDPATDE